MGPELVPGEAGLGCEGEPGQGDADFCQGPVVRDLTASGQRVLHGVSQIFPHLTDARCSCCH